MKKKQLIDVIFASEKRKYVLLMLKDGPQEMKKLLEELDTNRPALLPQIRILEDHSLVYQSGDSYGLTTIGKIVVDEMKPFLDTIEALNKHSNYLSSHNTESIPDYLFERISEIRTCKIIEPSLVNTYEINKDFFEKAKTSKSLRFVFTFLHPTFPEILANYLLMDIDISIILTQDLYDKIKNGLCYLNIVIHIYIEFLYLNMNCPKCKSSNHKKNGKVGGRQRYKCHDCGYNYTVEIKSTASSTSVKRQALQLYLEGLGFRSIGRVLGVSHVSVYKWIKKFGQELEDLKSENQIDIVELDEMHTYIGNKKNIAGSGLLLIELGKGSSTVLLAAEAQKLEYNSGTN